MTLDIQINLTDQSDINEGKVSHLSFQKCLKFKELLGTSLLILLPHFASA